jgi:alkaline phosphatase
MKAERIDIGRRAFLRDGTLILAATLTGTESWARADDKVGPALKIGLITDVHYANKEAARNRYYRESLAKVEEGVNKFNAIKADFMVQMGDLIDDGLSIEAEIGNLRTINAALTKFHGDRFYALGNHDAQMLSKEEFIRHTGIKIKETYYSFDRGQFHFVVLDGCFKSDGQPYDRGNFHWTDAEIPGQQRDWLCADLSRTKKPTIVFVHQRLDVKNTYAVKSAADVRKILETSSRVLAVFQGHSHKNDYREIGGIHYCTLRAVIEGSGEENNGYGCLNVFPNGSLSLEGFRKQVSRDWNTA